MCSHRHAEVPRNELLCLEHTSLNHLKAAVELRPGVLKNTVAKLDRALAVLAFNAVGPCQRDGYLIQRFKHRTKLPLYLADGVVGGLVLGQHLRGDYKPL